MINLIFYTVGCGIGGMAISGATLALLGYFIRGHLMDRMAKRLHGELVKNPEKSAGQMDETLNYLIVSLKSSIPMSGMLLSASLVDKLKQKLKGELSHLLPDILPKMIMQVKEGLQQEATLTVKSYLFPVLSLGFALGGLMGLILFFLK